MKSINELRNFKDLSSISSILGIKTASLAYILYKIPIASKYKTFEIPKKSGGMREINAPIYQLKMVQVRLAELLNNCFEEIEEKEGHLKTISHAFRIDKSISTNAIKHRNKKYVFNLDLKDFFPSINFGRVRGFFIQNKYFMLDESAATIIAQIACYNNSLPQGSPCSPVLSNFIGRILDTRLVAISKKYKCTYSRYADDITFSTNQNKFPPEIAKEVSPNVWQPSQLIAEVINNSGFKINFGKVSMQYRTSRQTVTGLTVNNTVNINREYYKNIRAYCHSMFESNFYHFNSKEVSKESIHTDSDYSINFLLNRLEGQLSFAYLIKNKEEKRKNIAKANKDKKNERESVNSLTKMYRKFLLYKHFHIAEKPTIICEGKTDYVYLKCALKNLNLKYTNLVKQNENGSFEFNLKFINFTENFKSVMGVSEGTTALNFLIGDIINLKKIWSAGSNMPLIFVLDTDEGTDGIKGIMSRYKIKDFSKPFYYINRNIYITFISNHSNIEMENLFDHSVTDEKIDGKSFKLKKEHLDHSHYGKHIFAEKVVKPNWKTIDFNKFENIFNNINSIIKDCSDKRLKIVSP
jgi:RNA-directed DNA polymerase